MSPTEIAVTWFGTGLILGILLGIIATGLCVLRPAGYRVVGPVSRPDLAPGGADLPPDGPEPYPPVVTGTRAVDGRSLPPAPRTAWDE